MIYHGHHRHLDDLADTVERSIADLRPRVGDFDSIAVTGMSGVIVGSPVALSLGKPLVVVRKKDDDTHDTETIINKQNVGERALFLDDFVSSGDTILRVESEIRSVGADVVAEYLYAGGEDYDRGTYRLRR